MYLVRREIESERVILFSSLSRPQRDRRIILLYLLYLLARSTLCLHNHLRKLPLSDKAVSKTSAKSSISSSLSVAPLISIIKVTE